jgi:hypothetical protein
MKDALILFAAGAVIAHVFIGPIIELISKG